MKNKTRIVSIAVVSLFVSVLHGAQGGGGGGNGNSGGGGGGAGNRGGGMGNADRGAPATSMRPENNPSTVRERPPTAAPGLSAGKGAAAPGRDLAASMREINGASFDARKQLFNDVDMKLSSSRESLKQIQANAKDLRADARADFKVALDDFKAKDKALSARIGAAKKADAASWDNTRSALATAYQEHSDALGRLEAKLPKPPALP